MTSDGALRPPRAARGGSWRSLAVDAGGASPTRRSRSCCGRSARGRPAAADAPRTRSSQARPWRAPDAGIAGSSPPRSEADALRSRARATSCLRRRVRRCSLARRSRRASSDLALRAGSSSAARRWRTADERAGSSALTGPRDSLDARCAGSTGRARRGSLRRGGRRRRRVGHHGRARGRGCASCGDVLRAAGARRAMSRITLARRRPRARRGTVDAAGGDVRSATARSGHVGAPACSRRPLRSAGRPQARPVTAGRARATSAAARLAHCVPAVDVGTVGSAVAAAGGRVSSPERTRRSSSCERSTGAVASRATQAPPPRSRAGRGSRARCSPRQRLQRPLRRARRRTEFGCRRAVRYSSSGCSSRDRLGRGEPDAGTDSSRDARRPAEPLSRAACEPRSARLRLRAARGREQLVPRARASRAACRAARRPPLGGVERLPARVEHDLDAALGEQRARAAPRGRLRRRGSSPARASSSRCSTVSVASFLFVPITPVGPRLIQPAQ